MNENTLVEGFRLGASYRSRSDSLRITMTTDRVASVLPSSVPASIAKGRVAKLNVIPWGLMLNDREGDCTIAGEWHTEEAWTDYLGDRYVQPDAAIHTEYRSLTGGADTGLALLDVLKPWSKRTEHGLAGYAEIPWTDRGLSAAQTRKLLKLSVWLAGAAYIAVELPAAQQQNAFDWTDVGTGPDWRPGTWGGHCVPILSYASSSGKTTFAIVTWGKLVPVSEAYLRAYMVEAWMPVGRDWANKNGKTPNGRALAVVGEIAQEIAAAA